MESVKVLAEMKKELEKRKEELEKEIEKTKLLLTILDKALVEQSFVPASELQKQSEPQTVAPEIMKDNDGTELAKIYSENGVLRIVPSLTFNADETLFKSFLVNRVLEGLKSKKEDLSYDIITDNNNVKEIVVRNVSGRMIQEIKNTTKWTLRRIKEKQGSQG